MSNGIRNARWLAYESLEHRRVLSAQMLLDYTTTQVGLNPEGFVEHDGELFFSTKENEARPLQIWKTDGSADGTMVVAELEGWRVSILREVNDQLLAVVEETIPGNIHGGAEFDLYRYNSDTFESIAKLIPENPYGPRVNNDFVEGTDGLTYFTTDNGGPGSVSLWSTDGTETNRVLSRDIFMREVTSSGAWIYSVLPLPVGNSQSSRSAELHALNFDTQEFNVVRDIVVGPESSEPKELTDVNGKLFFTAATPTEGRELWYSDGTATSEGTQLVADLVVGAESSEPRDLIASGSYLYYTADDGAGRQVWFTDENAAAPTRLSDSDTEPKIVGVGDAVFYTTGTAQSTELSIVENGVATEIAQLVTADVTLGQFDGRLLVRAMTSDAVQLWMANEVSEIEMIAEFPSGGLADPTEIELLSTHNETFTFVAGDSIYRSTAGNPQVQQVGVFPTSPTEIFAYGELLVYAAGSEHGSVLWVTDGDTFEIIEDVPSSTNSSTIRFIDAGAGPLIMLEKEFDPNQFSYAFLDNHYYDAALYTSEVTPATTELLTEGVLMPELNNLWGGFEYYVANDTVYFYPGSSDAFRGNELWHSDLTSAGTGPLTNPVELEAVEPILQPEFRGEGSSHLEGRLKYRDAWFEFAVGDDGEYFVAENVITRREDSGLFTPLVDLSELGIERPRFQQGIWKETGLGFNAGLFYFSGMHPETGFELWQSDGTLAGTEIVLDVNPGPGDSGASALGASNGVLYFTADDGVHGRELWAVTEQVDDRLSDLNSDGTTNFADFSILSANFGTEVSSREEGDIDGDGLVSFADFLLLSFQYNGAS